MKSFVKLLCGLSILGFATVACNKEVETQTPAASKHSVKVTAGISSDTRTEMLPSGNQTKWTNEDVANMHFFENGIAPAEGDLDVELNADKTQLTIMAEFANTSATQFVYTSILASNLVELDENKNAILDDEQFILDGTFDPLADILVAKPEERDAKQNLVEFSMQYKRVVAVNKIKIKGLEAGDKIESVTISSNKPFLGSYSMTNDAWTNSGYELTLNAYDEIEVSTTGEVSLYFITAPVENALLSLYVETDNHKYEKDFTKTITFAANTVTSFATTVAESEIEEHEGTGNYVRVESTSDLAEGEYVLVTEATGKVLSSITTSGTNKYGVGTNVSINNHTIASEVGSSYAITLAQATITSGAYTMNFRNSGYLYALNSNSLNQKASNAEEDATTNFYITIANGNASIKSVTQATRSLVWNAASSGQRFAFYKDVNPDDSGNSQHNVQLYKKDVGGSTKTPLAKPVVSIERNATLDGIIVSWNDVNKAANYTVTCTEQESQTIAQGVQTAEFTDLEPGTYVVTVTANPVNADRNTATTSDEASIEILDYQLVAPTLSFTAGEDNIVATWTAVPNAASYTYTVLGPDNAVVVEETNTEALTFTASNLTENTAYTFKIKSIGEAPYVSSDYATQTQKTLRSALRSIAEIKADLVAGADSFEANLTNAIITGTYSASGNSFAYIQDATAGILIMGANGLAKGDSFTGHISGNMTTYNNQPEITSINVSQATKTTGATIPDPVIVTIDQLNTNMATYDGLLCKIVKAKAAATLATGTNRSINIAQGESVLKLFTRVSYASNTVVKNNYYDVIGYPAHYYDENEIVVIETGKITETSITWQLKSIGIAVAPNTCNYSAGDHFDPTGLVISTVVEDASDNTIFKDGENVPYEDNESDFSFNPGLSDALTTDVTSVTISYGGKTATQAISVSADGAKTSTLTFTAKCDGSGTADDGVEWTVTSDGTESNFDNDRGIHYGTNSAQVTYINLTTSDIKGTISKVVVNASTASGVTATVDVAVDGDAFGGNPQSLSATATDYTFEGSASGEIVVTVTKPSKAAKALYVKSIAVTYTKAQ